MSNGEVTSFEDRGYEEIEVESQFVTLEKEGDSVEGIFKGIEVIPTVNGDTEYWKILNEENTIQLVVQSVSMKKYREFIREGDDIILLYDQMGHTKSNREFRIYKVYRKKFNNPNRTAF